MHIFSQSFTLVRSPIVSPGKPIKISNHSMSYTACSSLTKAASEPVLAGSLLYLLTRGPPHIRARLLAPFQSTLPVFTNTPKGVARLVTLITILKILTTAGVLRRVNQALNRLAWNNWSLSRNGADWQFGPSKEELVLITGGSSGFGYEMVKSFSKHARVVAIDISPFPAELHALHGVSYYQCDITNTAALEALCEQIKIEHGVVSVLINNAGIGVGKTILETSNIESQRLMQVNLMSHFALIRALVPDMLKQKKGHVVSIASMASFVSAPGLIDYCISKIGALYLTEGLRAECLAHYPNGRSICTSSIHPSWHQTGILKNAGKDLIDKHGIVPDPPTRVSDVVVEQVLAGRSGRICVPKDQERYMGIRSWPRWAQDLAFGLVFGKKAETFADLKEQHEATGGKV
ncbi:NAD(P)-binding protein [Didymella exigua CBS 183.55]|uniref:NAD(P)-binding protein n=1 Tax=Didymella exigua CBS 183.55 TaxID=1150837 RepID=A0A6A5RBB7_9PLEO|nr:NAD(P)-binding protein [Didymella exigua CBS 183.55]KAF1924639.1 NAD(P)-binding protein [Didymella exigua CBS 183.55]